MLATLSVQSGDYKVKEVDRNDNGITVKMLEDAPFAKRGEEQFVSPKFVNRWEDGKRQ